MSTAHVPTDERWYQVGPDPLVALRVYGTPHTFPLLFESSITLGRGKLCDLRVNRRYLSRQHVRFRWTGAPHSKLRAENLAGNDLVLNGELAQKEITLGAGDWFAVGDSRYFVLTDQMRVVFPRLLEFFGASNYALADEIMLASIRDAAQHFLLIGEPGSAQEQIAHLIHRVSRRRHNSFFAISQKAPFNSATQQAIRAARGGTVFVDVHGKGRVKPRVAEAVTRDSAAVRLIVSAPSPGKFSGSFPELVRSAKEITIPSIAQRKDEIPELLDKWSTQEASPLRFARLRAPLRRAITKYSWPGNFDELYAFGVFLRSFAGVTEERTARQVERDSSVLRSTRDSWEKKLGLEIKIPLMPGGQDDGDTPGSAEISAAGESDDNP